MRERERENYQCHTKLVKIVLITAENYTKFKYIQLISLKYYKQLLKYYSHYLELLEIVLKYIDIEH